VRLAASGSSHRVARRDTGHRHRFSRWVKGWRSPIRHASPSVRIIVEFAARWRCALPRLKERRRDKGPVGQGTPPERKCGYMPISPKSQ
jgi:hypothetical protein